MRWNLLSTKAMLAILTWLTGEMRPALAAIPELELELPRLDRLQARFQDVQKRISTVQAIDGMTADLEQLDSVHDGRIQAVWDLLTANVNFFLSDEPPSVEKGEALQALRDWLWPMGRKQVNANFSSESGYADQLRGSLTEDRAALLKTVSFQDGRTALDALQSYFGASARLGNVLRRRGQAESALGEEVNENDVRAQFGAKITLIFGILDDCDAPESARDAIRNPILREIADAAARLKERQKTAAASAAKTAAKAAETAGTSEPVSAIQPE